PRSERRRRTRNAARSAASASRSMAATSTPPEMAARPASRGRDAPRPREAVRRRTKPYTPRRGRRPGATAAARVGLATMEESMAVRYRCGACGNLTRFDVVTTRRTSAFHHYSVGGDLTVEDEQLLEETVERVTCRWCGASGDSIETSEAPPTTADAAAPAEPA